MDQYAWINGVSVTAQDAHLSVYDRGFQYGHGVFTTLRVLNGRFLNWNLHLQRLKVNCHSLSIPYKEINKESVIAFLDAHQALTGSWKLKIILTASSNVIFLLQEYVEEPHPMWKLKSYAVGRHPVLSKCKSLAYLENVWFLGEAKRNQVDNLLLTDEKGIVLETATSCVFWVVGNTLYTPDFDLPLLPSTALEGLLERIKGYKVVFTRSKLDEIADDAVWFAANALRGVVPVLEIDGRSLRQDKALHEHLAGAVDSGQ